MGVSKFKRVCVRLCLPVCICACVCILYYLLCAGVCVYARACVFASDINIPRTRRYDAPEVRTPSICLNLAVHPAASPAIHPFTIHTTIKPSRNQFNQFNHPPPIHPSIQPPSHPSNRHLLSIHLAPSEPVLTLFVSATGLLSLLVRLSALQFPVSSRLLSKPPHSIGLDCRQQQFASEHA